MIDVRYFEVRIKTTNLRLFNLKNPYFVAIFYARFVMFGLEKKHISNGHLPSSHSVSFFWSFNNATFVLFITWVLGRQQKVIPMSVYFLNRKCYFLGAFWLYQFDVCLRMIAITKNFISFLQKNFLAKCTEVLIIIYQGFYCSCVATPLLQLLMDGKCLPHKLMISL